MEFSNLVRVCEKAWSEIQKHHPEVPDAVIVVGSGGRRASTLYGHFAQDTWEDNDEKSIHEVLIVAEQLRRGGEAVFTTLLHEAVHGLACARSIKDVSGRRHNKKFGYLAEEMGMELPESIDGKLGYSAVTLSMENLLNYEQIIEEIDTQLKMCRKLKVKEKETKKTTWIAECECERKLRLPKKTIVDPERLELFCGFCEAEFQLIPEDLDQYQEQNGMMR